ncbi:tetratricopeptide repeat protein [Rugamonas sp.]|uniref:tetratricopeptide repeat protein n=1 Tax=Rugamonas sp. TaxID=1926287 RepID=UPI0025FE522B|nr:tetratricopeptide repeat protein [Rugamonas sp.]
MNKPSAPARPRAAPLDAALRLAIAAHQAGKPGDAERRYRAILATQPRHPDALHYLGVLLHQQVWCSRWKNRAATAASNCIRTGATAMPKRMRAQR